MQIDFHHAATYVLSRLAGFTHGDASTVAYASQYVDDSTNRGTITFDNGKTYQRIASAHTTFDVEHNCANTEDYQVWVPFHFLPGNDGANADTLPTVPLHQRLVCSQDSPLAMDMWDECRARKADTNALHRLGITAHVYCDTFSHQMFAGFRHQVNHVTHIEHIVPADPDVIERIESQVADELDLGHGGALKSPDLPYLEWRYTNGYGQEETRLNPEKFLTASERLFSQFIYYLGRDKNIAIKVPDLAVIEHMIRSNISADPINRHQTWLGAIRDGLFSFGKLSDEESGSLNYVSVGTGSWKFTALGATEEHDSPDDVYHYDDAFANCDWKKFHDALKGHQSAVLDVVLVKYKLPRSYDEANKMGL